MTLNELKKVAMTLKIPRRSRLNKAELREIIQFGGAPPRLTVNDCKIKRCYLEERTNIEQKPRLFLDVDYANGSTAAVVVYDPNEPPNEEPMQVGEYTAPVSAALTPHGRAMPEFRPISSIDYDDEQTRALQSRHDDYGFASVVDEIFDRYNPVAFYATQEEVTELKERITKLLDDLTDENETTVFAEINRLLSEHDWSGLERDIASGIINRLQGVQF